MYGYGNGIPRVLKHLTLPMLNIVASDSVELAHTDSLIHSQQQSTVNGSLHVKSVAKATLTIK